MVARILRVTFSEGFMLVVIFLGGGAGGELIFCIVQFFSLFCWTLERSFPQVEECC